MACISIPTAILIAGGVGAAGAVASSAIGSHASKEAAKVQAKAATDAAALQKQQFDVTQTNLKPFIAGGQNAFDILQKETGTGPGGNPLTARLTAPFNPTLDSLAATPGYKFVLDQGLKSVQNGYAAKGQGVSGPALRGAADYAEGLAGTTYQQQFENYLGQNQQIYNMLGGLASTGVNAATGAGELGLGGTKAITDLLTGGAAATAAGKIGSANALTGGIGAGTSSLTNAGLLLSLNNAGLFGGTGNGGLAVPNEPNINPQVTNSLVGY